jgi:hypothetical protein
MLQKQVSLAGTIQVFLTKFCWILQSFICFAERNFAKFRGMCHKISRNTKRILLRNFASRNFIDGRICGHKTGSLAGYRMFIRPDYRAKYPAFAKLTSGFGPGSARRVVGPDPDLHTGTSSSKTFPGTGTVTQNPDTDPISLCRKG